MIQDYIESDKVRVVTFADPTGPKVMRLFCLAATVGAIYCFSSGWSIRIVYGIFWTLVAGFFFWGSIPWMVTVDGSNRVVTASRGYARFGVHSATTSFANIDGVGVTKYDGRGAPSYMLRLFPYSAKPIMLAVTYTSKDAESFAEQLAKRFDLRYLGLQPSKTN